QRFGTALSESLTLIAELPKPTVAAITGYALGGGLELALTADRRVAGDNVKVGQPEIQLGIIPGAGGTQRLSRLVGPSKAKDIVFTGRFVKAEEALAIGLVDEVVAPDEVYAAAHRWASQFVNGPAVALRAAKIAIDAGLDMDLRNGLKLETQLFTGLWASDDPTRGTQPLIEHGPGKHAFEGEWRGPGARSRAGSARDGRGGSGRLQRRPAPQCALPRVGGGDLRREVVDLLRRAV